MRFIKQEKGFTLVEILIVILIIGILIGIFMPKFSNVTKSTNISAAETDLRMIKNGVQQHYIDNREGNLTLYEVNKYSDFSFKTVSEKDDLLILATEIKKDPWGNPYYLYISNDENRSFTVMSYGQDGKKSTSSKDVGDDLLVVFYPKFE